MSELHNTPLMVTALTARLLPFTPDSGFQVGSPLVRRAGRVYTEAEELELAELLPFLPQRILEESRDV